MNVTIPCPCPGKVHEEDTVTLKEPLDFRTRLTLRQTIKWAKTSQDNLTDGELLAILTEAYCLHCIESWTLVDEKGKPVPATRQAIQALLDEHDEAAMLVADAADEAYSQVVLLPLLLEASKSSPTSPTGESTSPTNGGTTPRKPSKPSSTTTSPMDVTDSTPASLVGVSS